MAAEAPRTELTNPRLPIEMEETGGLPPVLAGHHSAAVARKVELFYHSVAAMFEAWLERTPNYHTQRTYRRGVMNFIEFMGIAWPTSDERTGKLVGLDESWRFLQVTVPEVQAWRDLMIEEQDAAPATLNHRICSVSAFYKFMRETAAELRLPITVPNPAHAQFIKRETSDPVRPTEPLTMSRAMQLKNLPQGDSVLAHRDRAILAFYLYTGARIGTGCRMTVGDFHNDPDDPTVRLLEKGRRKSKRRVGIHLLGAESLEEYLGIAGITSGPLFRARRAGRSEELGERPMSTVSMWRLLLGYLEKLPRAMEEVELQDGTVVSRCRYHPHSLRATTATLLDDAGVPITKIQELLGHKQVKTTQAYIRQHRGTKESASHLVPL